MFSLREYISILATSLSFPPDPYIIHNYRPLRNSETKFMPISKGSIHVTLRYTKVALCKEEMMSRVQQKTGYSYMQNKNTVSYHIGENVLTFE